MPHHKLAQPVHAKIAAVAPIEGVSIGSYTDKSTWTVTFKAEATEAQKDAAAAAIVAFGIEAEEALLEAIEPSLVRL